MGNKPSSAKKPMDDAGTKREGFDFGDPIKDVNDKSIPQANADTIQGAYNMAVKAHMHHFGENLPSTFKQDSGPIYPAGPNPKGASLETRLRYKRRFKVLMPPEVIRTGHEPFVPTVLYLTVWIPHESECDPREPVQCTAADCPLANEFHYKGLYMARELPEDPTDTEIFGLSKPPKKIKEALKRLQTETNWNTAPKELRKQGKEDQKLVEGFLRHHLWG